MDINPMWVPVVGVFVLMLAGVIVVALVVWFKARAKELQFHQDLRIREMEHQQKMKELEVELEKAKALQLTGRAAS
jgi:hypothetical protein